MMLEGEIDIYPRFHPTSEWDTSSGQGLLESIGGGLLTLKGKPFEYNQRDTVLNGAVIGISCFGSIGCFGLRVMPDML